MVLGTSWLGYEFVLGTRWLEYELAKYELTWVRLDWKPGVWVLAAQHNEAQHLQWPSLSVRLSARHSWLVPKLCHISKYFLRHTIDECSGFLRPHCPILNLGVYLQTMCQALKTGAQCGQQKLDQYMVQDASSVTIIDTLSLHWYRNWWLWITLNCILLALFQRILYLWGQLHQ